MLNLVDKFSVEGLGPDTKLSPEGFLKVRARISRLGIYEYFAGELGQVFSDLSPGAIVRVFRSEDEVFRPSSMQSFAGKPVTNGHPWQGVNAENVSEVQVGFSGETFARDGDYVAGFLTIQEAGAVGRVLRGERELSAAYACGIERQSGEFRGEAYDAVCSNIVGNHIALVDAGRCGVACRVGDRAPIGAEKASVVADCGCKEQETMTTGTPLAAVLQQIMHDGFAGQMDANGAAIFAKVKQQLADAEKKVEALDAKLTTETATHAAAIVGKDAEIKKLQDSAPKAEDLDKLVAARVQMLGDAKKILGDEFKPDGKTDAAIKREAVVKMLGDAAVKDRADSWVEVSFESLALTVKDGATNDGNRQDEDADNLRRQMADKGNGNGVGKKLTSEQAREKYMQRLQDGYKAPAAN